MKWLKLVGFAHPPAAATNSEIHDSEEVEIQTMKKDLRDLNKRIANLKADLSRELCESCNYMWMKSLHKECPSCSGYGSIADELDDLPESITSESAPAAGGGARQGDLIGKDDLK